MSNKTIGRNKAGWLKEKPIKNRLLISFSGGRTSAYMTWWLMNEWADRDKWEMIVVFANTGKEREETLEFVNLCDMEFKLSVVWVEADIHFGKNGNGFKIVDFGSASRKGEPFEKTIQKYGIPNQSFPHCTRVMKAVPIKAYARSLKWSSYYTAIGIRQDEPQRLNFERAKSERFIYPLATMNPKTKSDIALWWSKQHFDLQLKSYEGNCDLCWKKARRKLMTVMIENPQTIKWWVDMENKYENYTPESRTEKSKPPYRFYRNGESIKTIVNDANTTKFELSQDESKDIDKWKQMTFFDMVESFDPDLDGQDGGCSESCEVF